MVLLNFLEETGQGWNVEPIQRRKISQEEERMPYVDVQYISVARKNEMEHHEHTMEKLGAQIAWLTKSVAWELEQHHSRIKELQQVEDSLATDNSTRPVRNTSRTLEPTHSSQREGTQSLDILPIPAMNTQTTGKPVPSPRRRRTKTKKTVNRSIQEHVAELVG